MLNFSIKTPEAFILVDENLKQKRYGCEQEWYQSDWQKRSGCGPTTACNLLSYIEFTRSSSESDKIKTSKEDGFRLMQESWEYVTPTENGIPTTNMFCENFLYYLKTKDINASCHSIDINQDINLHPKFHDVVQFIESAMNKNSPVAFLNLCNGKVISLERWHWVTIISIEYEENETEVNVNILDEGLIKKINLKLWYETTTLGGGFVYFEL